MVCITTIAALAAQNTPLPAAASFNQLAAKDPLPDTASAVAVNLRL